MLCAMNNNILYILTEDNLNRLKLVMSQKLLHVTLEL